MKITRRSRNLSAHNKGLLAFLTDTRKTPPPVGKPNTVAAAFRAGWHSAKAAMEKANG